MRDRQSTIDLPAQATEAPVVYQTVKKIATALYQMVQGLRNDVCTQHGFLKFTKKTLVSLLICIIIFFSTGLFYLFNPFIKQSKAAWFDDNWAYRQRVPVSTHASSETNVYIEISVDTATMITNGKLQSDCDDLRFTKISGDILPYDITGTCNNAATTINVGFDTMPIAPFDFYMYFGNPSAGIGESTLTHATCASTCTEGAFATEEKGPGPTLYWKFDDGTIGTAQDSTANNFDGTHNNTPTIQTEDFCIYSKCLWFDGTNNENVSKSDDALLDFVAADNFSVHAWVKRNGISSTNNVIMTKASGNIGTTFQGYKLYMDTDGDFCFETRDGTLGLDQACTSSANFDDDRWHHVVGTKQGTTAIRLYVDGKERASDTSIASTGSLANTGIFYVGIDQDALATEWLGFIDEVKVYRDDSVRSAAQIAADFNSRGTSKGVTLSTQGDTLKNISNGLVGYWKADESSTGVAQTDRVDSSGNSTTLTDTNTTASAKNDTGTGTGRGAKFADAADFESTNSEYLFAADNAILSITGSLTLAAWIKPETVSAGSYNILAKWDGANESYRLFQNGDEIRLELDSSGNYVETSSSNLATATFYHVVGVYNSSLATALIYINGELATTTTTGTIPSSIGDDAGRFHIGAEDSTTTAANFYDGVIDDARVYSRAFSNQEARRLYNFGPTPVLYWKLDEKTGTTANDSSGNANSSSSFNGNTTWANGKYSGALTFDGTNDNVRMTETSSVDLGAISESITVEGWAEVDDLGDTGTILAKWNNADSPNNYAFHLFMDTSERSNFQISDATNAPSVTDATKSLVSGWHHITGVRDVSTDTIYVYTDGVLGSSTTDTTTATLANNDDVSVGNASVSYTTTDYSGRIDEVKIYNYARTLSQIIEDMNAGHPAPGLAGSSSSPVGYWKFDESATSTNVQDSSGSNNDLTDISNPFAQTKSGKFGSAWNGGGVGSMSRADDRDFDFAATEEFSISFWVKSDNASQTTSTEFLISKSLSGGTQEAGYAIYFTGETVCFAIDDDTTWDPDVSSCTSGDFYDTTWHYITAVRNTTADTISIYVDGLQKDSDTDTTTATLANGRILYAGDRDGTNNGDEVFGDIDELKIFRIALTPEQIKIDMNQSGSQVLGSLSDSSNYQVNAAAQEYCVPGGTDCDGTDTPVAEWRMDEKTGTSANDNSSNVNTLTLTGSPTWTLGKFGAGINFNGSNQYLTRSNDNDFNFGTGSFTISAWFKHDVATAQEMIIVKYSTAGWKIYMESDGDITCGLDYDSTWTPTDSVTSTAATYDDGKWHNLSCVKNGTTSLTLYLDGASVGTPDTSLTASSISNTDELNVGIDSDQSSNDWIGQIDQIRVFNYVRTASQAAWDYNRGGPAGWWKFDECQGTTLNDASGTNTNNGTWSGSGGGNTSAGTCSVVDTATAWYNGRTGKYNFSLDFDGTDDVVTVTNASSIDLNENLVGQHSFSAWIYPATAGEGSGGQVYWKGATTYLRVDTLSGSNLDVEASLALATSDASVNISAPITTNSWNHIVVLYTDDSDDEIDVYINGILRGTSTNGSGAPAAESNNLLIGGTTTDNFDGQIDDFKVFNYALTATQIKTLYGSGAVRFGPSTGIP